MTTDGSNTPNRTAHDDGVPDTEPPAVVSV
jgi:hypothetical protein